MKKTRRTFLLAGSIAPVALSVSYAKGNAQMTTYNTGNPLGSKEVKDLFDNAQNFDNFVNNKDARHWPDRFGKDRLTWYGMEERFQEFLINSGYQGIGDYVAGLELTARNQMFYKDGELYRASATLALPYTLTGDWAQEKDLFVAMGDASLRQDLSNPDIGDKLISVRQPLEGAIARTQGEKNLDHVSVLDMVTPEYPSDATAIFAIFESSLDVKSIDLMGGRYLVSGLDLTKHYYNGTIINDGAIVVEGGALKALRKKRFSGLVKYPIAFNNPISASISLVGGVYEMSDVFSICDWSNWSSFTDIYVSYKSGVEIEVEGAGSRDTPYKYMSMAFSKAASAGDSRIVILDRMIPRQGAGGVDRNSNISLQHNLKIQAGHSSGECLIGTFNDPALHAWARVGATKAYKITSNLVKMVFDNRVRDWAGNPTPLRLADNQSEVETNPGMFYFNQHSGELFVSPCTIRPADGDILVCQSTGSWNFNMPTDKSMAFEGLKTLFTYNQSDGVRITPRFTSANTATLAIKNCDFIGSDQNGLSVSRIKTTAITGSGVAWNARDGFSYHDAADQIPSTMVAYESGCYGYGCGQEDYSIDPANTGSDNCSTAHEGMTILRSNCNYIDSKDGVVADVNGCTSLNYGVNSGESRSASPEARASFVFNDVNAVNPSRVYLIGCSGGGEGYNSISTGGDMNVDVRVSDWRGDLYLYSGAVIRDLKGGVVV